MKSPEEELMDFLLENPHLAPFQAGIMEALTLVGNDPEKRLEAFSELVEANKAELAEKMQELLKSVEVLELNLYRKLGGKSQ